MSPSVQSSLSVSIANSSYGTWLLFQLVFQIHNIQNAMEISVIIVTDDYLRYKEPKIPYSFLLLF